MKGNVIFRIIMNFKLLKVKNLLILSSIAMLFAIHNNIYASTDMADLDTDYSSETETTKPQEKQNNNDKTGITSSFISSSFSSYSNINGKTFKTSSNFSNQSQFDENGGLISSNTDKHASIKQNDHNQKAHTKRNYHREKGGIIDDEHWKDGNKISDYHEKYNLDHIQTFTNYKDSVDKLNNEINELIKNNYNFNKNNQCTDCYNKRKHNKKSLKKLNNEYIDKECIGKNCGNKKYYNEDCVDGKCFDEKCYGNEYIDKKDEGKNCKNDKTEVSKSHSILNNLDSKYTNINQIGEYDKDNTKLDDYNKDDENLLFDEDDKITNKPTINTPNISPINDIKNENNNKNEVLENNVVSNNDNDKPLVTDTVETKSNFDDTNNKLSLGNNTIPLLADKSVFKDEEYKKFQVDNESENKMDTKTSDNKNND